MLWTDFAQVNGIMYHTVVCSPHHFDITHTTKRTTKINKEQLFLPNSKDLQQDHDQQKGGR